MSRLGADAAFSILSSLRTSPSRKSARSSSWFICLRGVSLVLVRVSMPDEVFRKTEVLAVPKNMKLLAIPLFELYDNAAR